LDFRGGARGNADDQARGRYDAIVGPEHRRSQPPDAADEVVLQMGWCSAAAGIAQGHGGDGEHAAP